jgi:3-oxoacyl-[acyl-carrier-protein] synthase-3
MPSTPETAEMKDCGDGNIRALDHMYMDGTEVLNFVMREVPPLVDGLYKRAGQNIADTDYFLFHQPNKFILDKLAEKMKVDKSKMPMDLVEKTGNPSGASIPLITALDLKEEFLQNSYKCCLSGFGSGLAFGAVLMDFGGFEHCEVLETEL